MLSNPAAADAALILILSLAMLISMACEAEKPTAVWGLTGRISGMKTAAPAAQRIKPLSEHRQTADIDLRRMAQWAMNYLTQTPRRELDYEPVFQCHPLQCPPVPEQSDPIVSCDTDARMDWEWYYMRDISGSRRGRDIEAGFHKRIRSYVAPDGRVWSAPGAYREADTNAKYEKKDYVVHTWGGTKILKSLSEDYLRTRNPESKALARRVMLALKKLARWDSSGRCWFDGGMGPMKEDGTPIPNGWNAQPAPIVEPLVTYYLATRDPDGLAFARAYADGMIGNCQPGGIRFQPDGIVTGGFGFGPHSHATMHAVWGVAHLGVVAGEKRYVEFARRIWDWMLSRGTGTGWFPAGPDNCNETCCISDMMSVAALVGRGGHPEYYDALERFLRNYISNLQFIVTPQFEAYYRELNAAAGEEKVAKGLLDLRRFQGGFIGGSGLNDYENRLLGGASGFEMFGCCAPEGMRAVYTAWSSVIDRLSKSVLGPAGVYVNMTLSRDSRWGKVVSFVPSEGRLTVRASVKDAFFLRPPSWAPREQVGAFVGTKAESVRWSGAYVRFDAMPGDELTITYPLISFTQRVGGLWKGCAPDLETTFNWLGNMVTASSPEGGRTSLFTGKPRTLPPPPGSAD